MPLPRFQPGTGNLGAAQPIVDEFGNAYNKGVDFVEHPIKGLEGMLGMNQPAQQGADPGMVKEANDSFLHPAPVVAPPRRKPIVPRPEM